MNEATSNTCGLLVNLNGQTEYFQFQWSLNPHLLPNGGTIDLLFQRAPPPAREISSPYRDETPDLIKYLPDQESHEFETIAAEKAPDVFGFITQALQTLVTASSDACSAFKMLVPTVDGYISRSDAVTMRMNGCILVDEARSFTSPLQQVKALPSDLGSVEIFDLCASALGGVRVRASNPKDAQLRLQQLEAEFINRLSFDWISSIPLSVKRLAFVQGRADAEGSIAMWEAARNLGIALVIFDAEGHWLQDPKWSDYREAFVPTDIMPDEKLPERLISAIRSYGKPFHGIMTVSDSRLAAVARAAEQLGLTTNPPEAYDIAGDKFLTRKLEPSISESFECTSAEHIHNRIANAETQPLRFPLLVKPCTGWGSECVSRVENEAMLLEAVEKACSRHQGSVFKATGCVVEPYISGPEFDANFVLFDGEIVFFQIADDYPSRGDSGSTDSAANCDFLETQVVSATQLPAEEQAIIREQIHASILRQGFKSGVFHCEGRVRDSAVEFRTNTSTGHMELVSVVTGSPQRPSAYLIENNARTPGYMVSSLARLTYGIDYFAIQMLCALGPEEIARFKAMATPFRNGAQYYSMVQYCGVQWEQSMAASMTMRDFEPVETFLRPHPPGLLVRAPYIFSSSSSHYEGLAALENS
ncbi:ATP-grasp superfamily protein [Rutstroemia sp. NJR-2017a WRK4]|nr:ATP-grasp superfamily protein [Rutstroemia sp. NJR-2017a WRK4]